MQAFILAGGFATRLWPLTEQRAKPLLPLAGKPIITHLLESIPEEIPVTVSTNAAFAEKFGKWREEFSRPGLELVIEGSKRDDQKKGALGALAEWVERENVRDDLLLLTGDNYLGFPLSRFLAAYGTGTPLLAAFDIRDPERAKAFGTVIVESTSSLLPPSVHSSIPRPLPPEEEGENTNNKHTPPPKEEGRGVEENNKQGGRPWEERGMKRVIGFEEKPPSPKTTLVSTGCSVLPKEILPVVLEFARAHPDNVGGLFEELVRRNIRVDCFTFTEPWLDIGSFHSYLDAHRLLVGERLLADPSSSVDGTLCTGSVAVGKRSAIRRSELHDCIVFEECTIEDSTLKNCIIDDRCTLRGVDLSNKMLRTGTALELPAFGG